VSATVSISTDPIVGIWNYYSSSNTASATVVINGTNTYTITGSSISLSFSGKTITVNLQFDAGTTQISVSSIQVQVTLGTYTLYKFTVNCTQAINIVGTTTISISQIMSG
jgi:hypothetical protein